MGCRYPRPASTARPLLFPEDGRAPPGPLDPRTRIAADVYNRALTLAFRRTEQGTIAVDGSGVVDLPFGRLTVARPAELHLDQSALHDLKPVAEVEVRGLRNRYRRPGIGAPLAAKTSPLPGVVPVVPGGPAVNVPLAAVVVIGAPLEGVRSGDVHARLELLASLDADSVEVAGRPVPLRRSRRPRSRCRSRRRSSGSGKSAPSSATRSGCAGRAA